MAKHFVQFLQIKIVVVDSPNDIQAEKDAWKQLKPAERIRTIASQVWDAASFRGDPPTADSIRQMKFDANEFGAIDRQWLDS